MNASRLRGPEVRYLHENRRSGVGMEHAREHLTLGTIYTVKHTCVIEGVRVVELRELPGVLFNAAHFEYADAIRVEVEGGGERICSGRRRTDSMGPVRSRRSVDSST